MNLNRSASSWRGRTIRYAPLLFWIAVIFYLSSSQGSMEQTSRFIGPFLKWLFPAAPPETLEYYHGFVRKLAHFAVYAVLSLLAVRAFYGSSAQALRSRWGLAAIFVVLSVAVMDEINQSQNPLRTGSPFDVVIDLTGGAFAILFFWLLSGRRPKKVRSDEKEHGVFPL
ncbi:MAG: VanZ family protein [Pyrinomonadaceae bacterium]